MPRDETAGQGVRHDLYYIYSQIDTEICKVVTEITYPGAQHYPGTGDDYITHTHIYIQVRHIDHIIPVMN